MSKAINDLKLPDDVRYSDDHEWAKQDNGLIKVGISDYAQDQLGDIVFVELPDVGNTLSRGDEFGTLESVKAVSQLYTPISGEVTAVNEALVDAPEMVNSDPYSQGWMMAIRPSKAEEFDALMVKEAYLAILKG